VVLALAPSVLDGAGRLGRFGSQHVCAWSVSLGCWASGPWRGLPLVQEFEVDANASTSNNVGLGWRVQIGRQVAVVGVDACG
jgi:hypothetical protein